MDQPVLTGLESLEIIRVEPTQALPPNVITDVQRLGEILNELDKHPAYSMDTETTGLNWRRDSLHGMSVGVPNGEWYVFDQALEPFIGMLKDLHYHQPRKGVIGHNLKFDLHFLSKYGYRPKYVCDTMIAQKLIDENVPRGLKALSETRLGISDLPEFGDLLKAASVTYTCSNTKKCTNRQVYKDRGTCPICGKPLKANHRKLSEMTIWDIDPVTLTTYAARDARLNWDLWEVLKPELRQEGMWDLFFDYDMPYMYVLMDMEEAGVYVNQDVVAQMRKEITEQLEEAKATWRKLAGEVNYNSTDELRAYLYTTLKLETNRKTKKGKDSTDALTLMRLEKEDKTGSITALLKLRETEKLMGTYIETLENKVGMDGRIRTDLNQDGAVTGRLSSSEPNLQNIPSRSKLGKRIREAFQAQPGASTVIIDADYSQLELRILAHMTGEPAMIQVFEEDGDPHAMTAEGLGVARHVGKTVNFGSVYGQGPRTLADTIEKNGNPRPKETDAKEWLRKFDTTYPFVTRWKREMISQARQLGYVSTLLGHRRRLAAEINAWDEKARGHAERQAGNAPIQGSASDVIEIAMLKLDNIQDMFGARMLLQVHDELIFECPEESKAEFMPVVQDVMEGVGRQLNMRVKLVAEPGDGVSWLAAK